jgi:hypothetical protein
MGNVFPTIWRLRKWLKELAVEVYDTGIQKVVPRLQKCPDLDDDYIEKLFNIFVKYAVNFN